MTAEEGGEELLPLSGGRPGGFYELTINRLCWFPEWRIETNCLLLLSCVQARRDTRFKEEMAELPRRLCVPESSERAGEGKHYKRCSETPVLVCIGSFVPTTNRL